MRNKKSALKAFERIQGLNLKRSERALAQSVSAYRRDRSLMKQLDNYTNDYRGLNAGQISSTETEESINDSTPSEGQSGLVAQLANGHRFLNRLGAARTQQKRITNDRHRTVLTSRTGWRKKYEAHKALEELIAKRQLQKSILRSKEEDRSNMESWFAITDTKDG